MGADDHGGDDHAHTRVNQRLLCRCLLSSAAVQYDLRRTGLGSDRQTVCVCVRFYVSVLVRTTCPEGQLILRILKTEDILLGFTTVLFRLGVEFRVKIRIRLVLGCGKCPVKVRDYRQ